LYWIETTSSDWKINIAEPRIQLRSDMGDAQTMKDIAKLLAEEKGKSLYEMRIKLDYNIFRLLGFFDTSRFVVLVNGFQKKTQKTPRQDIRVTEKRKRDYVRRKQDERPTKLH